MPRSATANIDVDTGIPVGIAGPRKRIYYYEDFRLMPYAQYVAGTIADTPTDDQIEEGLETNKDWELDGGSTACAFSAEGGIALTTGSADDDQAILIPNGSSILANGLNTITWDTDKRPAVEWCFSTTSTITSMTAWCGFKLAAGAIVDPYNTTTDNDSVVVEYVAGEANFRIRYSTDTADGSTVVDYSIDTGIAVAINTTYVVKIALDSDRVAWVNIADAADLGAAVEIPTKYALKSVNTFKPTLGLENMSGSARTLNVRYVALGRDRLNADD